MPDHQRPDDLEPLATVVSPSDTVVPRATTVAVWTLFLLSLGLLVLAVTTGQEWAIPEILVVDGLTTVMWVVVTFFSGIVHSFSRRYMAGEQNLDGFFARIFAFTLVVMTMTTADHLALFVAAWLTMGLVMASLIGHVRDWPQAQAAARSARRYFLASSGLLAIGVGVLAWSTGATSISAVLGQVEGIPAEIGLLAIGCIVLAAMIQSALFPFHRWLLSSMTAPTPASALMHAGFVNAGGILLTRFAPLLSQEVAVMSVIVLIGAVSALLGQAFLLVQTDVKRKLGASTVAQMGFMILQCGLGFFAAAITHLILHGCYKAYLFLSSGAAVEQTVPKATDRSTLTIPSVAVSLVTAIGGGVLFAILTGKGTELNSGLVLTFVVVVTTMHATRDILRRPALSPSIRLLSVPLVVLTAISAYALTFNAISTMIAGAPMAKAPTDLTGVHIAVVGAFGLAYMVTELGWHRSSKRLYVALLNASQPEPSTILTQKEDYNDA